LVVYERPSKRNKIAKADICPHHDRLKYPHTWLNCFGNPAGPKYKEGYKLPDIEDSNSRKTNHSKQTRFGKKTKQDMHHQEEHSDGSTEAEEQLWLDAISP
jgi:hypothetical protein